MLDALLEHGRRIVAPSQVERSGLDLLADAGLVRVGTERVFRCFDARDDGCAHHPTRACATWVPVPPDLTEDDEDAGAVVCPACGVEHAPLRDRRTISEAVRVALDEEGVIAWMDAALRALDPEARRQRQGVAWEATVGGEEAEVTWLDRSTTTRLATRAYATARPVVYVVTSSRAWSGRFRDDPWLEPVPLAAWVLRGPAALEDALARRRGPLIVSEPAVRPWSSNRALDPRTVAVPLGARRLVVESDRATLDGHEVIAREGVAVLALLRVLVDAWRDDIGAGKSPADFCTWTPEDLRDALKDTPGGAPDTATVRRQLGRLRAGMRDRYQQATGVLLDDDAVIEHVAGGGYRVNPVTVLAQLA